eukprot:TRINITY_DN1597_c0_g1_i11.p3 TRINITY_DN1597_c0_g1~~TRINITY_DN1597_c0_g1_i11.p3  ORF type:complete len:111 (+),score=38.50 TRINITY_DN1597_c0_g1_i11:65-397(+)
MCIRDRSGAVDQLTRVLVSLYEEPEKPTNSIDFIKKQLGSSGEVDVEKLKAEFEKVKDENVKLKKRVDDLQKQINALKGEDQQNRKILCFFLELKEIGAWSLLDEEILYW